MMRAGFQGHVKICARRDLRRVYGIDLGMRPTGKFVPARGDEFIAGDYDTTDAGIRICGETSFSGLT